MAAKRSLYGVHPGVAMMQDWERTLKAKTGRSLEEWIALTKKFGPRTEKERRGWLKKQHNLGSNSAWWIAERAEGRESVDDDREKYLKAAEGYVEAMFPASKAALRPIYDALLQLGLSMGADVKACPCKTTVPLYRKHVFAQIKPTTRMRIDLGLALGDTGAPKRLIDTGGFAKKDRITHRIEVTKLSDIDAEMKKWLKTHTRGTHEESADPRIGRSRHHDPTRSREPLDLPFLASVGIEVLDPRGSHRQFRCRKCGTTWRPHREISGQLRREDWLCWRGCNSMAGLSENEPQA